jgi:hypothetical protein
MTNRRDFLGATAALAVLLTVRSARGAQPSIHVSKDPNCGCCAAWADHLRLNGFMVSVAETSQINRIKARLGVPSTLVSCHTAEIEDYVIEGHVPAGAIQKLLRARPQIKGLAVPGMPVGSPGMELEGTAPEIYDVIAFGPSVQSVFARYEGARQLPER